MSAAPSPAFGEAPQRVFPRLPVNVRLDLIALRSGVPDNLPGRCTDISEAGVGVVVAGELVPGQQVAVELRLPNVGVPVRARALVSYQSRLRCGLKFIGLSAGQREMIRYWVYRSASEPSDFPYLKGKDFEGSDFKNETRVGPAIAEASAAAIEPAVKTRRRIRIGRRGLFVLIGSILVLAALGWWQWQRSWSELEKRPPVGESRLRLSPETRVSSETIEHRI